MVGDDLRFAGYAALFGRVDRGGDVIRAGAFGGAAVARRAGRVPLLWQHDGHAVAGVIEHLAEDERGLRVIGRLSARGAAGRRAIAALRSGDVKGLSFGYRVERAREGGAGGGAVRELLALDLTEVSLVTHPMQPLAVVHAVE